MKISQKISNFSKDNEELNKRFLNDQNKEDDKNENDDKDDEK